MPEVEIDETEVEDVEDTEDTDASGDGEATTIQLTEEELNRRMADAAAEALREYRAEREEEEQEQEEQRAIEEGDVERLESALERSKAEVKRLKKQGENQEAVLTRVVSDMSKGIGLPDSVSRLLESLSTEARAEWLLDNRADFVTEDSEEEDSEDNDPAPMPKTRQRRGPSGKREQKKQKEKSEEAKKNQGGFLSRVM